MIKKLSETPKVWLTLSVCGLLFETFRKRLEFDEPIPPFNQRFKGRLESILGSVKQTYGDKPLNATILDAAAAYFNQLIRGHAFQNGNKRMAILFTHYFLLIHGLDSTLSYKEMYNFAVAVARSGELGISAKETKEWSKKIIAKFTRET